MKLRLAAVALGAIATTAVTASAQITGVTATFLAGSVAPSPGIIESSPSGSYYVGPYTGSIQIPGQQSMTISFNCVDFFHDVVNTETWSGTLSDIGTMAGIGVDTRVQGSNQTTLPVVAPDQVIDGHVITPDEIYRAAAYLISQYPGPTNPESPADQATTIMLQDEIWQMTSILLPTTTARTDHITYVGEFSTLCTPPATTCQALTDAINQTADRIFTDSQLLTGANYWDVLTVTGLNADGTVNGSPTGGPPQEFIVHVTPEPGTLTLLGSGLFAVLGAGFTRRRKRNLEA